MSRHPKDDMLYDGDEMHWHGVGKYHATSGLPGHQTADQQTVKNAGPIPEGLYLPAALGCWQGENRQCRTVDPRYSSGDSEFA